MKKKQQQSIILDISQDRIFLVEPEEAVDYLFTEKKKQRRKK